MPAYCLYVTRFNTKVLAVYSDLMCPLWLIKELPCTLTLQMSTMILFNHWWLVLHMIYVVTGNQAWPAASQNPFRWSNAAAADRSSQGNKHITTRVPSSCFHYSRAPTSDLLAWLTGMYVCTYTMTSAKKTQCDTIGAVERKAIP